MKRIFKAISAILFTMLVLPYSALAQSIGLNNASNEVWGKIQSFEINKLPANDSLLCLKDTKGFVQVGVLLRDGDFDKYYRGKNTITANVWMFIPCEIYGKYGNKDKNCKRFCQFLGLDTIQKRDTVALFFIAKDSLFRPSYNTSPYEAVLSNPNTIRVCDGDATIREWFAKELKTNSYPWTRMGYTYDWGQDNNNHFGATEFVCKPNSKFSDLKVMTLEEFLNREH